MPNRKLLFRLKIAWGMLEWGSFAAYQWLLPRRWKVWTPNPREISIFTHIAMESLARSIDMHFAALRVSYSQGTRIGDTISVRKPARFCR